MRMRSKLYFGVAPVALAAALAAVQTQLSAQQAPPGVTIGATDLGGVVTGPNGPEAGVWVIAETKDLPTRYAKMVVTDDQGRYVVPDLPKAKYSIWVRGYGLVDSPKVESDPGKIVNLKSVPASTPTAAAQYYPAIYWYSMLKMPDAAQFGPKGIPVKQAEYINLMKNNGCVGCHQLGPRAPPTIRAAFGPRSRNPGCSASSPARPASSWSTSSPASCRPRRSAIWRIGPTGSPRASCRTRRPSVPKASSATSWSRPTTGRTRSITCTTRSRPTSATPASMRPARSTDSLNTA